MKKKIILGVLFIGMVILTGCRTGEYNVDLEIYEEMPALLAANEELAADLAKNEDGTIMVEFEKGEMFLHLRAGRDMDEGARNIATQTAFQIFHQQYLDHEDNLRGDGTFYRKLIVVRGFVEDTELYILEWNMNDEEPKVRSNRFGNYM
ncbi:hypothetical protein KAU08_08140 [bacterium]|nr:hypothetical protein [bacterium]